WNGEKLTYKNTYLPNEYVTKIIKDKNHNYWFTSLRNGVFVMPNIYIKKVTLPDNIIQISTICSVNNNHLAFGTPNGIIGTLNSDTFKSNPFSLLSETKVSQLVYNFQYKTLFISQESQSYLWNLSSGKITNLPFFQASKSASITNNNSILNASYDRASILENPFSSTLKKSEVLNYDKPSFINTKPPYSNKDIRFKRAYTCLHSSKDNSNYVGFVDELIQFDTNLKETIIRYKKQPIFAIDLAETKDNIIWVSTFKDGILGIKNNKVIFNYTTLNGLLSNQTGKLKSDGNTLWITTEKGLQSLDVKNKSFRNITKNDGLDTYSISDIEILGNKLFISSNKGIYLLEKDKCFKTYSKPIVSITNISIQERDTILKKEYNLAFDKNGIKIIFNTNSFQSSESIVYQYRLVGLNNIWLTLDKGIDFVRYSSLPSGEFVFEVKSINKNNIESQIEYIKINVAFPFWQKWWFYLISSFVIIFLVWIYFRLQLRRKDMEKQIALEKAEIDKELIYSQLENLRSQMNPHFIFNALNSIQEYILTNEKQTASAFLVKFSRLIRIYLEHSRESEVKLKEELKALQLYLELEKDRFEDSLEYSFIIDDKIDVNNILIPSLFIQPYIENALKHGLLHKKENRILSISFELNKEKDSLICIILDNGIGRKASTELNNKRAYLHKSFATSANEKRIELINKTRIKKASVHIEDLYDEKMESLGTKVVITMPFK
ncbi:histidine kinase, partial [Flavobacterium sp.]|uniref:sensor histidine kinase n=1 Tax=Flavobacterium sp. TaxID=239 RepID=UPI00374CCF77